MMENLSTFFTNFDVDTRVQWAAKHWQITVYIAIFYVIATFTIQRIMQQRNALNLRRELLYWNVFLAIYSAFTAYYTVGSLISDLYHRGFHHATCSTWMFYDDRTKFWTWLFPISKIFELIDTLFILLRKNRLIFLHWYHHATVLVYCFYSYGIPVATGTWFITLNAFVHTVMYSYYALKASGQFKIPTKVNLAITTLQILQMVIGCGINIYAGYNMLVLGGNCQTTKNNLIASLLMYLSYFVLFGHFFYKTYVVAPRKSKQA